MLVCHWTRGELGLVGSRRVAGGQSRGELHRRRVVGLPGLSADGSRLVQAATVGGFGALPVCGAVRAATLDRLSRGRDE